MKRLLFILCLIFCVITFASCEKEIIPEGLQPTKDFTVDSSLDDFAIYKADSRLVVSGTAEANVTIHVEIVDEKGKVVETSSSSTDKSTNRWVVSVSTPKASFDSYTIKVSDSYGIFPKQYNNILFGKVWMIAGDNVNYITELDLQKSNPNIRYNVNNDWVETSTNNFLVSFAESMKNEYNMPIGIIDITEEGSVINSWLPLNTIKEVNKLKDYLVKENKYNEDYSNNKEMSYVFETKVSKFRGISLDGVLFNHGLECLDSLADNEYYNHYFLSLVHIISEFNNIFNNASIKLLGAPSSNDENVVLLRDIQSIASNYFNFSNLIPLFDLNEVDEEKGILDIDLSKLISRVISVINGDIKFSSYANLIYEVNEKEIINKILIEFNNTEELNLVIEEEYIINYLDIYYDTDEKLELEDVCIIEENFIVINLEYQEISIVDDEEIVEDKIYDKSLITISYGRYANLLDFNLMNDSDLPILPFKIDLN